MKKITILLLLGVLFMTSCKKKVDYTLPENLVGTTWVFTKTTETESAYTYNGGFVTGTLYFTSTTEATYTSKWNKKTTSDYETYTIRGDSIFFTIYQYSQKAGKKIPATMVYGVIYDDYIERNTFHRMRKYYLQK